MNDRAMLAWPGAQVYPAYPQPPQQYPHYLVPPGQQLATPIHNPTSGLDKLLSLESELDEDFRSAAGNASTSGVAFGGRGAHSFSELRCAEDRDFAERIIETLYKLEPDNGELAVMSRMGTTQFYVWMEQWRSHVIPETFNLLQNIPYPKQNVGGVRTVAVWNSRDGVPSRVVVGFVPQHMATTTQPTKPAREMMMLSAPVRNTTVKPRIRRADSDSEEDASESPARRRDSSPAREKPPAVGFFRKALGLAPPEPKTRGRQRR
jgi:hypothetical protein